MRTLTWMVAALAFGVIVPGATASVGFVDPPSSVKAGAHASLRFEPADRAKVCSFGARSGSHRVATSQHRVRNRVVRFKWRIPRRAKAARWVIRVACAPSTRTLSGARVYKTPLRVQPLPGVKGEREVSLVTMGTLEVEPVRAPRAPVPPKPDLHEVAPEGGSSATPFGNLEPVTPAPPAEPIRTWTGWLTSAGYEDTKLFQRPSDAPRLMSVAPADASTPATVSLLVDAADRKRPWRGVGASLTDESVRLLNRNPRARELLFSRTDPFGARLNLLRLPLSATDFSRAGWTWSWNGTTASPAGVPSAMAAVDLLRGPVLALQPNLQVIATAWTAPGAMKTKNALEGGSLAEPQVEPYGRMLVSQAAWLSANGVPLKAITLGNEPFHAAKYPTMQITTEQQVQMAKNIARTLRDRGVELWAVDHNWEHIDEYKKAVEGAPDSFAAAAFHCYNAATPGVMGTLKLDGVITECTGTTDGSEGTFAWDMSTWSIARSRPARPGCSSGTSRWVRTTSPRPTPTPRPMAARSAVASSASTRPTRPI